MDWFSQFGNTPVRPISLLASSDDCSTQGVVTPVKNQGSCGSGRSLSPRQGNTSTYFMTKTTAGDDRSVSREAHGYDNDFDKHWETKRFRETTEESSVQAIATASAMRRFELQDFPVAVAQAGVLVRPASASGRDSCRDSPMTPTS